MTDLKKAFKVALARTDKTAVDFVADYELRVSQTYIYMIIAGKRHNQMIYDKIIQFIKENAPEDYAAVLKNNADTARRNAAVSSKSAEVSA